MASTSTSITTNQMRRRWPIALGLLAVLTIASCGGDDPQSGDAPADDAAAGTGAALYEQSCAECHGSDLRGTDQGPSQLSQVYAPGHHDDASYRAAIAQGSRAHHWNFGDMAPVEGLDDDEVELIIAYVRDQQETHGFEPYPPG